LPEQEVYVARCWTLCFIVALAFCTNISSLAAEERVITASATSKSRTAAAAQRILEIAYREIGYVLKAEYVPGKRSLFKANNGQTDGELARIKSIGHKYPNLVRVPESLFDMRGMAYVRNRAIKIQSLDDLKHYRVGHVRGIQWAVELTTGQDARITTDADQLFQLLANDRLEIALESFYTGTAEIRKNFSKSEIAMLEKPLVVKPFFHYLHKKNGQIVDPLNRQLRKMKDSGEIDRILGKYLESLN
jgi:polar amino acid transport system substrate-binding protein